MYAAIIIRSRQRCVRVFPGVQQKPPLRLLRHSITRHQYRRKRARWVRGVLSLRILYERHRVSLVLRLPLPLLVSNGQLGHGEE